MSEENKKKNNKANDSKPDENIKEDSKVAESSNTNVEKNEAKDASSKEEKKEGLKESEIIDLTKDDKKKKQKTTADFVAADRKRRLRKRIIILVVIAVLGIAGFLKIRKSVNDAKEMISQAMSTNVQTAFVEKKVIKNTVTATGTLRSNETRTLTTILNSSSKITEVNAKVGDYVNEGDVIVRFSTEDINKQISEAKEDISNQRQQDSIQAEDDARNYIYSYSTTATNLRSAAKSVDNALQELHEACNAYGDAKRELQRVKDEGAGSASTNEIQEQLNSAYESKISQLEQQVASAYQAQQQAQAKYDDAVENEAKSIADQQNGLSDADSKYKQANLQAGSQVKTMERKLEDLEDSLENYVVTASISGVVTQVNVEEGNSFQNGDVITIQDMSAYTIELSVSEYDIAKVKSAYEKALSNGSQLGVVIKTEATEDREFAGHVISIAPTSTSTAKGDSETSGASSSLTSSSSSGASYSVKAVIDEKDDTFMVGMTAKAAIVVEESPADSFAVPYNAVFESEDGDGTYFVKVVDNSEVMNDSLDETEGMVTEDGILVENSTTKKGAPNGKGDKKDKGNIAAGIMDNINTAKNKDKAIADAQNTPMNTREVKVTKVFETDYYTAIIPVNKNELSENDEVILANEDSGNDMYGMMMGLY